MRLARDVLPALSHHAVALGSAALLLSGLIQLAVSWMQMQHRGAQQCACTHALPSSPDFEKEYSASRLSLATSLQCNSPRPLDGTPGWVGDDYPPYLPLDLGEPVVMVLEDSRHYALNSSEADAEWESIYPGGQLGFVHLGPNKRFFSLSLYHQIHCLVSLRSAILDRSHHGEQHEEQRARAKRDVEHSAHCLNYLRQTIMCNADLTLEPEIEEGSQNVGEGLAAVHVCRDWSKVHAFAQRNWEEWQQWMEQSAS